MNAELVIGAIKALVIVMLVLGLTTLMLWFERKGAALIQDRIGANRADIFGIGKRFGLPNFGIINTVLADPIKMFTKEDFVPDGADRFLHALAPFLALFPVLITFAVAPMGDILQVGSHTIDVQPANLNVGALYVLATIGIGVYGIALGGWASNNRWAMLGGIRASAQMISYEIAMSLAIIAVVVCYGTLDLQEMCRSQGGVWALRHHRAPPIVRDGFDDNVQIRIFAVDAEHRGAAHSVEWLQDDVAVCGEKLMNQPGVPRDQRRRHELRKTRDCHFFVAIPDRARIVEHTRALRLRQLEEIGAVEVLHVERRVLAHQHRVEILERRRLHWVNAIPRSGVAGEVQPLRVAGHHPVLPDDVFLLHCVNLVRTRSRFAHHRECGILVYLEIVERVDDESDFHGRDWRAISSAQRAG